MKNFPEFHPEHILHESRSFVVVKDGFPVSPGHCLIISKAMKETFFDLSPVEREELVALIGEVKGLIEADHTPDGYNIGMNCGEAAGQTVMQFHCHVIPRYAGDMADPSGGIRHCIPSKGAY